MSKKDDGFNICQGCKGSGVVLKDKAVGVSKDGKGLIGTGFVKEPHKACGGTGEHRNPPA